MILVVGASGKVGRATARLLLDSGAAVRGMSRDPRKLADLKASGADLVEGDLRVPASLLRACEGAQQVLAAAHAFDGRGTNTARNVDDAGNRALIDAARIAGARRFVFMSAIGVRPDHPVDFFRYKYEIEQYLRASGMEWVILRAAPFMETWAGMIGDQIAANGTAPMFGRGDNAINFVSVQDVARYAVMALQQPDVRYRVIDVGGPENVSQSEIINLFEAANGQAVKRKRLAVPVMRTLGALLRPFDAVTSRIMRIGVLMATTDQTFDMSATLREYPMELTRLEDYVRSSREQGPH